MRLASPDQGCWLPPGQCTWEISEQRTTLSASQGCVFPLYLPVRKTKSIKYWFSTWSQLSVQTRTPNQHGKKRLTLFLPTHSLFSLSFCIFSSLDAGSVLICLVEYVTQYKLNIIMETYSHHTLRVGIHLESTMRLTTCPSPSGHWLCQVGPARHRSAVV